MEKIFKMPVNPNGNCIVWNWFLLFVLYFPFKESDNLIKIGIIYVVIALVANGLMLIKINL